VKKLLVIYEGWGERWTLGTLADTGQEILFEYSAQAIERGLQLSPLHQPLPRAGAPTIAFKGEVHAYGLPGFIADALPDGWGMLLMDRVLRKLGRNPREVSVLTRLAIAGGRAMGALSFEPAENDVLPAEQLELKVLAKEVEALHADHDVNDKSPSDDSTAIRLKHLMQLGGSPQGARPKVLVDFNSRTGKLSSGMPQLAGATPWLIKFPAQGEYPEVCAIEELYARVARQQKMDMPSSRFFDLGAKYSAFGVERFDRVITNSRLLRVPIMSLSALLQADHRLPSLDYETLLLATSRITGDQREVVKAFERCLFNVVMHNRDDHSRNFAFRLNEQGHWKLSPAFDLTYSFGPDGEHSTSIAGHGKDISRAYLIQVARKGGLSAQVANQCIDDCLQAARGIGKLAKELPIRNATMNLLQKTISLFES
jgi:serine/threonine-protein kinase HipA